MRCDVKAEPGTVGLLQQRHEILDAIGDLEAAQAEEGQGRRREGGVEHLDAWLEDEDAQVASAQQGVELVAGSEAEGHQQVGVLGHA